MQNGMRIIDANLNRVSEGTRVLEDFFRFSPAADTQEIITALRQLRHSVRSLSAGLTPELFISRDVQKDPGVMLSHNTRLDSRNQGVSDLLLANFKRIQEGLRSIEEVLKAMDLYDLAKAYESLRFLSYTLEKDGFFLFKKHTADNNASPGHIRDGHPTAMLKQKTAPERKIFPETDIYCLTAESLSRGRSNIEVVELMIAAGIEIIQYREKDKSSLEKYRDCLAIREMTKAHGVTFIVNDDVALAIMVGADGVHVGQNDYPVAEIRRIVGPDFIIGLSTHTAEEAMKAQAAGVDYIGVGPIYHTATKKDVCAPVGHAYLDYVVKHISIPFVAIGGIKEDNLHQVSSRGASCIALVSDITGAEDISLKIKRIRKRISETMQKNQPG